MSLADLDNSSILPSTSAGVPVTTKSLGHRAAILVPRLGVGSRSWVGSENLTAAISETPINLCDHVSLCCEAWDSNEGLQDAEAQTYAGLCHGPQYSLSQYAKERLQLRAVIGSFIRYVGLRP